MAMMWSSPFSVWTHRLYLGDLWQGTAISFYSFRSMLDLSSEGFPWQLMKNGWMFLNIHADIFINCKDILVYKWHINELNIILIVTITAQLILRVRSEIGLSSYLQINVIDKCKWTAVYEHIPCHAQPLQGAPCLNGFLTYI